MVWLDEFVGLGDASENFLSECKAETRDQALCLPSMLLIEMILPVLNSASSLIYQKLHALQLYLLPHQSCNSSTPLSTLQFSVLVLFLLISLFHL